MKHNLQIKKAFKYQGLGTRQTVSEVCLHRKWSSQDATQERYAHYIATS